MFNDQPIDSCFSAASIKLPDSLYECSCGDTVLVVLDVGDIIIDTSTLVVVAALGAFIIALWLIKGILRD
jgi:hypothetical protein